ncbi:hypothetical protein [Bacillus massiliglaciei]|uniref:hypothetical protein n=1 Tax=Bacillus massiliglaciei TaxID=1816693 RepID=UPI0018FE3442|nr:hypothetical protein [Bacillus massiliglaciei]
MDVFEFRQRFSELSDKNKENFMCEVFGMMKALDKTELLVNTLNEYEQKSNSQFD